MKEELWKIAILEELHAMEKKHTWVLIELPLNKTHTDV